MPFQSKQTHAKQILCEIQQNNEVPTKYVLNNIKMCLSITYNLLGNWPQLFKISIQEGCSNIIQYILKPSFRDTDCISSGKNLKNRLRSISEKFLTYGVRYHNGSYTFYAH